MYHFSWVELLEAPFHAIESLEWQGQAIGHNNAVAIMSSYLIAGMLILFALVARRQLNTARATGGTLQYVPASRLSVRNIFEIYVSSIMNLCTSMLSKADAKRFFWLIGGLFIYILCSNLLAVIPGGLPPTDKIGTNASMALVVFLVFNYAGIKKNGLGYFKHMAGPVWWLAWLIFPIELVGLIVRPVSLSLRLMGNMVGDHTVFGIMSDLTYLVVPAIFLGLGIFVSFIQAFVFTLLTIIYIALSLGGDDQH
jgi:F-type H+-transporting ATPase subunit a